MNRVISCGVILLLLTYLSDIHSQTVYLDSVYSKVTVSTYDFTTDNNEVLQLDLYRPDQATGKIPCVVYIHGGGFSGGRRDSKDIIDFATRLAQRGYAVASVSYRLLMKGIGFGCEVPAEQKVATIDAASLDASYAIQKLLNTPEAGVDANRLIITGSSAGAEVVLNMAYVYDNPVLQPDFRYAGVIGMAGAITTLDGIDRSTAIPTQLFHGTGDQLVPYSVAPHHYCGGGDEGYLLLYGSGAIAERLKGLGTSYYLYAEPGGSHAWAGIPMFLCFDEIVDFLYNDVISVSYLRQTERIVSKP